MSLYILEQASLNWQKNQLYQSDPEYFQEILKYKNDEYENTNTSVLQNCSSITDLKNIDEKCEKEREKRHFERNYLYDILKSMPNNIKSIVYYTQYIKDDILIDFDKWEQNNLSDKFFIEKIKSIQPNISV